MRTTPLRLLAALVLLLFMPTHALAMSASFRDFFSIQPFDRSPQAVCDRFNQHCNALIRNGQLAGCPKMLCVVDAPNGTERRFSFYPEGKDKAPIALILDAQIGGTYDESGKISCIDISIRPMDRPDNAYLASCDQLIQIGIISLFDALSEHVRINLMLCVLYDLRPFNYHSDLEPRERSMTTVVSDTLLKASWSVQPDGAMSLCATIMDEASEEEKIVASNNNTCNRLLSQTSSECGTIVNCLHEMQAHQGVHAPDWSELAALNTQIQNAIALLLPPLRDLAQYEKATDYCDQLGKYREVLLNSSETIAQAIETRDERALSLALDRAIAQAQKTRVLIRLIGAR